MRLFGFCCRARLFGRCCRAGTPDLLQHYNIFRVFVAFYIPFCIFAIKNCQQFLVSHFVPMQSAKAHGEQLTPGFARRQRRCRVLPKGSGIGWDGSSDINKRRLLDALFETGRILQIQTIKVLN